MTVLDRPLFADVAADYDALGRKQPQRLGFIQLCRAIPGLAEQFTGRVPGQFYALVEVDTVDVACPCKQTPRCERWVPTPCACERVYVYTGRDVRVAYIAGAESGLGTADHGG